MFYYYVSNCLSPSLLFSHTFIENNKPWIHGCLKNTGDEIFNKQLRA